MRFLILLAALSLGATALEDPRPRLAALRADAADKQAKVVAAWLGHVDTTPLPGIADPRQSERERAKEIAGLNEGLEKIAKLKAQVKASPDALQDGFARPERIDAQEALIGLALAADEFRRGGPLPSEKAVAVQPR